MSEEEMKKEESNVKMNKFIAIVDDAEKGIVFQVVGINMDEAIALITKGYVLFQRKYEDYVRRES